MGSGGNRLDPVLVNVHALDADAVPRLPFSDFREAILETIRGGGRLCSLSAQPVTEGRTRILAVLALDTEARLTAVSSETGGVYPSLTPDCPEAHWFEREIAEEHAVEPRGHPWLKPIRFLRKTPQIGVTDYFQMKGPEVHEVAVGPVHAGIIEPGHFRFQCHGEHVFHLEISLGYQHRGVKRALGAGPDPRSIHLSETLAGDTSVGHATAYCHALEALAGLEIPPRAQAIRGIALELERLANHVGDLGALAGDVGYLPTASYCGRIRGDFLNMTAVLCGNRFGRGLLRPGGVAHDLDPVLIRDLENRLGRAQTDVAVAVELLWKTQSVRARFEETGGITPSACREIGLVGPAARACGLNRDVRKDHPSGIFRFVQIPVSTWDTCDVFARAYVRHLEIQHSLTFVREQIRTLPGGGIRGGIPSLPPEKLVVSLVEGWRGEICHIAQTDREGRFAFYQVVDPSFHNWFGLALAMRGQQISDFPLCNKSFNLSYCGHDL
jgi:Ni,Fe-hydrogenase III large subunit